MPVNEVNYSIENNQTFELISQQISTIDVYVNQTLKLDIVGLADSQGTFLLNIHGEGELTLNLNFMAYSKWNYLVMNRSDLKLVINEVTTLEQNAHINANYGELSEGSHTKNSRFILLGHHAHLEVQGASIAFNELNWKFNVVHRAKDTYAMVKNYGIVFKGGQLGIEILGHIEKGQHRSKTHQLTRVMNMEEKVKAKVYPKLVIDENDVEASHAASVGQPDPDTIYYLQSRGLPYERAIEVITLGYLMPIVNVIENDIIREQLTETIHSKVIR